MKKRIFTHSLLTLALGLGAMNVSAFCDGYCDPDSLTAVTKSGKAMVITTGAHTKYMLDEDEDGTADYNLNFGPWWYEPQGSSAVRPADGDDITIDGGLNESNPGNLPVIVVYEINDLFWRNPYEPFWNNFNSNYSGHSNQQGNGYNCGWLSDSLTWITAEGEAILDTTFKYVRYYLDTNLDEEPDYRLNFGPYWYEPESGISLPEEGEWIKVEGALVVLPNVDMIVVSELNDEVWRDSFLLNQNMVGQWMHQNMTQSRNAHAPFDEYSRLRIHANWGAGNLPDSFFCQIMEVLPQNMLQIQDMNAFAGFEIGAFHGAHQNLMHQNQWRLTLNNQIEYQFHYHARQLERYQIQEQDEANIRVMYWKPGNSWVEQSNVTFDTDNNLITFSSNELRGMYILTYDGPIGVEPLAATGAGVAYPNPSRDGFYIPVSTGFAEVQVVISDYLGREVLRQTERDVTAGSNAIYVDARKLPAGTYFMKLISDGNIAGTQKLVRID